MMCMFDRTILLLETGSGTITPDRSPRRVKSSARFIPDPGSFVKKNGPVTVTIQCSAKTKGVCTHVDKLKHCKSATSKSWLKLITKMEVSVSVGIQTEKI